MRTQGRRPWIKLYPIDCLQGSIRYQLESDERGVWYDLLNFAAICAIPGIISDKDNRPYPHTFIANRLNIDVDLLERTLTKCIDEGRIDENDNGIHITNWKDYQSEYARQKPYREVKRGKEQLSPREDLISSELYGNYEKEIGVISPAIVDDLKDFSIHCQESNMPVDWIPEAFAEAAKNNKRNWAYVKAILNRWISEGKGKPKQDSDQEEAIKEWEERQKRFIEENSAD